VGFVSAVVAVGEVLRLGGFEVSQDLVGVNAGPEMLVQFLALLILQSTHYSVVICALNQHSLVWNACQFVVNLKIQPKDTL
jgi:hypothetical protein